MVSDWLVYSHVLTGKLDILRCYILDDSIHTLIYGHSSMHMCVHLPVCGFRVSMHPLLSPSVPLLPRKREGEGETVRPSLHYQVVTWFRGYMVTC